MQPREGERRRRGRPRIGEQVRVRIPEALLDEMYREARRRGVDLTDVIRDRCSKNFEAHNSQAAASSVSSLHSTQPQAFR